MISQIIYDYTSQLCFLYIDIVDGYTLSEVVSIALAQSAKMTSAHVCFHVKILE